MWRSGCASEDDVRALSALSIAQVRHETYGPLKQLFFTKLVSPRMHTRAVLCNSSIHRNFAKELAAKLEKGEGRSSIV